MPPLLGPATVLNLPLFFLHEKEVVRLPPQPLLLSHIDVYPDYQLDYRCKYQTLLLNHLMSPIYCFDVVSLFWYDVCLYSWIAHQLHIGTMYVIAFAVEVRFQI